MATRTATSTVVRKTLSSLGKSALSRGALHRYRFVVACVKGNVSVRETISRLLDEVSSSEEVTPTLVLGPTAPEDLGGRTSDARVGWVTFVDGATQSQPPKEGGPQVISPDNLLEVNLFIEGCSSNNGQKKDEEEAVPQSQLIIGDFLDNIIKSAGSPESFYGFLCQLASRVRMKKRTAILVIKEDIHERSIVEMVKRFADIVIELRDQEDEDGDGELTVEMRTLNFADNIYTRWLPFPAGLKPLSSNS